MTTAPTSPQQTTDHAGVLAIEGMTCASCVGRVERAIKTVPGVQDASVNLTTGLATVQGHAGTEALVRAVRGAGYDARVIDAGQSAAETVADITRRAQAETRILRWRLLIGLIAGFPLILMGMLDFPWIIHALHDRGIVLPHNVLVEAALATLVMAVTGWPFFVRGIRNGLRLMPNMDTLVALGAGTAYVVAVVGTVLYLLDAVPPGLIRRTAAGHLTQPFNEYHAAVAIVVLVTLGKYLEARAKRSANTAVAALAQQTAQRATLLLLDGTTKEVAADEVAVGDRLQVLAHQQVPVDGELLDGAGSLDASIVTGESVPVALTADNKGHAVPGGTTLVDGRIVLRATSTAATSAVARIVSLVQTAQASKTGIQALADKVAGIFTPIVIALGLLTLILWLAFSGDITRALEATIATVVIACPCAMGLATPTAITVATGRAARLGILFTQARALETARTIDTVLFDKTGTLTQGKLRVVEVSAADGNPRDALQLAASAEQFSTHPLAEAIVKHAAAEGVPLSDPDAFNSVPGGGVKATLKGQAVLVGSVGFLRGEGVDVAAMRDAMGRMESAGETLVAVATQGRLAGVIGLRDTLRDDTVATVNALRDAGVRVGVVSGDSEPAVRGALAEGHITMDLVLAGVRPEEKAAVVGQYGGGTAKGRVAFVGDGVNDAPALAAADLGITMATGTDVAKAAGDVILVSGKLGSIPQALRLASATIRVIKQNLAWAFGYNIAAIPLAMAGILPPGVAAAAMMLSSVSVVTNALRLYRVRLETTPRRA